jgi:DNA invertase Pin-like site-specific DNA recombinase
MSKDASNFRRTDVKRAIQAAASAGLEIGRIELRGGKVVLVPADDADTGEANAEDIKL